MLKSIPILQKIFLSSPGVTKDIQATIYSFIVSKLKYGATYRYWREILQDSQWWDDKTFKDFQLKLINSFLIHVKAYSPFYSTLASLHLNDYGFNDINELIKYFPIINKSCVRNNRDEIIGKNIERKLYKFSSSGTTGTALHVFVDREAYEREYAFRWHYLSVGGASRKSRFAYFLGNKLFPIKKTSPPFHITDYYEKGIFFSIFHMSNETLLNYVKAINAYKPEFIKGYPSGLYTFASYIKQTGKNVPKIKALYAASEVLRDYQKELIEEVFQAPIYQWYGQVETTVNIHECEKRRLHIKEEYGFLELINEKGEDAKPNEIASVIGTGWGNKAFPLIRYDTGDNMILSEEQNCPCGRNGRIIKKIIGRDEDVIITPENRIVGRLDFVFKPIETVKESQIIQEDLSHLTIKVVPLPSFTKNDKKVILNIIQEYLGGSFIINIEEVEHLERTKTGKIKYVISKLN